MPRSKLHLCGLRLVVVASLLAAVSSVVGIAAPRERATDHFLIHYQTGFGAGASSETYIESIARGLENAYTVLLSAGFSIGEEQIPVHLVETPSGELGFEYLEADAFGQWHPVIEIAVESVMQDYLAYAYVETSLEDLVASTCAHELFHVIQDYHSDHGIGDISEQSFVEAHATAVQELVVPSADDYLEPALDLLLAPDGVAFFQRTYDAGIFWVYVLDRLGAGALLAVMEASAAYDGRHALDAGFARFDLSFSQLWSDFAVALATGALPDAPAFSSLVPADEGPGWWTRTRPYAPIPPVVYQGSWLGETITIDTVNATQQSEVLLLYEDDAIGSPLRVAHAYGIDILEISIENATPLSITFTGDVDTAFWTSIASETSDGWSSFAFENTVLPSLEGPVTRIRLIVSRSESGTGTYSFVLRPL